jgi:hypothetical protein
MTLINWCNRIGIVLAASIALCGTLDQAMAEADGCRDVVGTYLTKNFAKGGGGGGSFQPEPDLGDGQRPSILHRFR